MKADDQDTIAFIRRALAGLLVNLADRRDPAAIQLKCRAADEAARVERWGEAPPTSSERDAVVAAVLALHDASAALVAKADDRPTLRMSRTRQP